MLQDNKVCMTSNDVTLHTGIATKILFTIFTHKLGAQIYYINEKNWQDLSFWETYLSLLQT